MRHSQPPPYPVIAARGGRAGAARAMEISRAAAPRPAGGGYAPGENPLGRAGLRETDRAHPARRALAYGCAPELAAVRLVVL